MQAGIQLGTARGVCVGVADQRIYIYRNRRVYECDHRLSVIRKSQKLPMSPLDGSYGGSRTISRIARRGVISGLAAERTLCLWTRRSIYILCREKLKLLQHCHFGIYHAPLSITHVKLHGEEIFLFGEYSANVGKATVRILGMSASGMKEITAIPQNEIQHIHSLVWDGRNTVIALCGDFGDAASIWKLNLMNMTVKCLVRGQQLFRGATGFIRDKYLYYPTDTTTEKNWFVRLDLETMRISMLFEMPASVIYGSAESDYFAFSTNLEASLETKNTWRKWLTKKLPRCFTTNHVHIYTFDAKSESVREITSAAPTNTPYRLFQYPAFRVFIMNKLVVVTGTSVQKLDGKVAVITS